MPTGPDGIHTPRQRYNVHRRNPPKDVSVDIEWTDEQLREAGISKRKLSALVRKLLQCTDAMQELGLSVYGSDGAGYLVHKSRPDHDSEGRADYGCIVARIGAGYDGGGW